MTEYQSMVDEGEEEASRDYSGVLGLISDRERAAQRLMKNWRHGCVMACGVSLGLVLLLGYQMSQHKTVYKLTGMTAEGHVRVVNLPEEGWTVTDTQTRSVLHKWLKANRVFSLDDKQTAEARLWAWNMSLKAAQNWLAGQFQALPIEKVGKVTVEVESFKPVPPTTGRTWELYWEEKRTDSSGTTRKAFGALVTVVVREPTTDEEADHLGVWVEWISADERSGVN
jgi:type IV secretory pathway TrbF-like protein